MSSKRNIRLAILLVSLAIISLHCKKNVDQKGANFYIKNGLAKHNLNDFLGAIKDYTEAIELNPKVAAAYYYRGFAKHKLKDDPGAIQDYTQAIQINPTYTVAYLNRGLANLALGARQAGCKDMRKAREFGDARADDLLKLFCK